MKKNVLITGGFGLLGQSLVRKIDKKKYNIFLLDKIKYKKRNRFLYDNHKKINIVHGNFNNIKFISKLIKDKDKNYISHRGGNSSFGGLKDPFKTYETSITGAINILESVRKLDKKIIVLYIIR